MDYAEDPMREAVKEKLGPRDRSNLKPARSTGWGNSPSDLKATGARVTVERTEAQREAVEKSNAIALEGMPDLSVPNEDPPSDEQIIAGARHLSTPFRMRQREELIRHDAAIYAEQVAASTATIVETSKETEDFDAEAEAMRLEQEDRETDAFIANSVAERQAAGEDVPDYVPGEEIEEEDTWTNFDWGNSE
jgi:hypothetical protein